MTEYTNTRAVVIMLASIVIISCRYTYIHTYLHTMHTYPVVYYIHKRLCLLINVGYTASFEPCLRREGGCSAEERDEPIDLLLLALIVRLVMSFSNLFILLS
jgi:hypothetical protein